MYKMRSVARENGQQTPVDLNLEFEGKRAFVIWDTITLGKFELKARVEIDPAFLQAATRPDCDFLYNGQLVLSRAENN